MGKFSRSFSLTIKIAAVTVLVGCFQNCSPTNVDMKSTEQSSTAKGGGDVYGGKVYVYRLPSVKCSDGSDIASLIVERKGGSYALQRDNCKDLRPERILSPSEIDVTDGNHIIYEDREYLMERDDSGSALSFQLECSGESRIATPTINYSKFRLVIWGYRDQKTGKLDMKTRAAVASSNGLSIEFADVLNELYVNGRETVASTPGYERGDGYKGSFDFTSLPDSKAYVRFTTASPPVPGAMLEFNGICRRVELPPMPQPQPLPPGPTPQPPPSR